MSSSTVTYTSVYTDSGPWRFQWISDEESKASQSLGQAPPSPDYVPGPEHPPLSDYVSGPEEPEQVPLSPDYVPGPEYPEYLPPGYVADSNLKEDLEEDLNEDPADGRDDDDESSDDDDDDNEDEQEAFKDDDEEEEHLAPVDSSVKPVDDRVPLAKDTEAFKTDESAPTLVPSPRRRTDDTPEADMPLRKRAHFTAPTSGFKVRESLAATAARQPVLDVAIVDGTPGRIA
uniref:Uncharacterized protein n=1 Tax=Tanacetum cinerariifolium TaxID=118510 RepID=A0A6L2MDE6_TANCI|nr:hypothetical protein [Tanacetum cinerariifolium]